VTRIDVQRLGVAPSTFRVTLLDEDGSSTTHTVRIDEGSVPLAERFASQDAFVEACFRFLLAREPKESILPDFDVTAIGRYFPGWERTLSAEP
jgi:hypothetical protein